MTRLLLVLLFTFGVAYADEVEVIQLRYRTAEQVIPTLRPLVEPGGAISGMQSTVVIRASRRTSRSSGRCSIRSTGRRAGC